MMLAHFIVETDYQVQVKKMQHISVDGGPLGHLLNQTQALLNEIGNSRISYVLMNCNVPALLARHACELEEFYSL